jgi:hypothetical protein
VPTGRHLDGRLVEVLDLELESDAAVLSVFVGVTTGSALPLANARSGTLAVRGRLVWAVAMTFPFNLPSSAALQA